MLPLSLASGLLVSVAFLAPPPYPVMAPAPLPAPLLAAASARPLPMSAATREITLTDALRLAAQSHPGVAAHQADLAASDAMGKVAGSRLLPTISALDMFNWVDSSVKLRPAADVGAQALGVIGLLPHKLAINAFIVSAKQPLLNLLPLAYDWRAARAETVADRDRLAFEQSSVETDVRTRFASLFRARAMIETAQQSEVSLADQVQRVKAQLAAGSATRTDVLRLEAALAQAQQQRVSAEASETVERAYLLELLGLAAEGDSIAFALPSRFVDDRQLTPTTLLRQTALNKRADLSAQVAAVEALRLQAKARGFDLLPSIEASANYANLWGRETGHRGPHLTTNAFFAGVTASWPVWAWGGQWHAYRAAQARAQAARSRLENQRREIGADVAARHATVVASDSAVALADAQVASAEEAFRVMVATLAAEAATTTDLLDAEASQTRARNALVDARFGAIIARLQLAHALGAGPSLSQQ